MKYGTSKYNTIKYGRYQVSQDIRLDSFGPISKVRIKTESGNIIAKTISAPLKSKFRVNGVIAYTVTIPGCYNKVRVRNGSSTEYVITRTVK